MINLRFVNIVWGEEYTRTFTNYCLPSTLSAGNLPFVASHCQPGYRIYSTAADIKTIRHSAAGQHLESLLNVEYVPLECALPNDQNPQKYNVATLCYQHFIKTVSHDGSGMVFLTPDTFWANDSFRRLFELVQRGKRLIWIGGLRLTKENFIERIDRDYMADGALKAVSSRELVNLAMHSLHPETESLIWGSEISNRWPSLLLWRVKQEGLLLRAFHMQPILVRPVDHEAAPMLTLDDDYGARACPNPDDEYFVQDSDEMIEFELSRRSSRAEFLLTKPTSTAFVANWTKSHAKGKHLELAERAIRIHVGELSDEWKNMELISKAVLREIKTLLEPSPTNSSQANQSAPHAA